WMGTTIACAQCHSHKFDPITQEEYFRMFAIFNNTEDADVRDEAPLFSRFTDEQRRQQTQLQEQIAQLEKDLRTPTAELLAAQAKWDAEFPRNLAWKSPRPATVKTQSGGAAEIADDASVFVAAGTEKDVYTVEIPAS